MNNRVTFDSRALRNRLGLTQTDFWSAIGVGQGVGSRYERKQMLPQRIAVLVRLVHHEQIDIHRVKGEDLKVVAFLRQHQPGLLRNLKAAVRAQRALS